MAEKMLAISSSLTAGGFKHAFGGAIALAYCIEEPRGTRDIDVNVFVPAERAYEATAALPPQIQVSETAISQILQDGQTRVWWDETPIDLFLNNLPLHDEVAAEVRWVPFSGRDIPVLSCESLVLFKAFFNRAKDWGDIETIADTNPAIIASAASRVEELVGPDDEFTVRLRTFS